MSSVIGQSFIDDLALRHLDAAYNLGRWLLGNEHEAADAVHDAYLRAVRAAGTYAGGNERAWWLAIVRNCCLARLALRNKNKRELAIDDGSTAPERWMPRSDSDDVENHVDSAQRQSMLKQHLQDLPLNFREVLILREIEELSYREIADALEIPIGTVMSRLARGRDLLQKALAEYATTQAPHGL
ncbi:MAG: sigma-70 family RNA polymerase sigma factor [Rhodanobacter sp.]